MFVIVSSTTAGRNDNNDEYIQTYTLSYSVTSDTDADLVSYQEDGVDKVSFYIIPM